MTKFSPAVSLSSDPKKNSDYVFYELTRSICPECRRVFDGHDLIRIQRQASGHRVDLSKLKKLYLGGMDFPQAKSPATADAVRVKTPGYSIVIAEWN